MQSPDLVPLEPASSEGDAYRDSRPYATVGFTVNAFPRSVPVKEESGLPWMLVLAPTAPLPGPSSSAYPFDEPREGSTVMQDVPRCRRCHGFVSRQCPVLRARYWECALCGHGNVLGRELRPLYRPHRHLTPTAGEECVYEVCVRLARGGVSEQGQGPYESSLPAYVPLTPAHCPALVLLVLLPSVLLVPAAPVCAGPPSAPAPPAGVQALTSLLDPFLHDLRQHTSAPHCRLGIWLLCGSHLCVLSSGGSVQCLSCVSCCLSWAVVQDVGGLDVLCPPMASLLPRPTHTLAATLLLTAATCHASTGQGGATLSSLQSCLSLLHAMAARPVGGGPVIEAYRVLALCPPVPPQPKPSPGPLHASTGSQGMEGVGVGRTVVHMQGLLPLGAQQQDQDQQQDKHDSHAAQLGRLSTLARALGRQGRVGVGALVAAQGLGPAVEEGVRAVVREGGGHWWEGEGQAARVWAVAGLSCAMRIELSVRTSEGWAVGGSTEQEEAQGVYKLSKASAPPQGWGVALPLRYVQAWGLGAGDGRRPPVLQLCVAYSVLKATQVHRVLRVVTVRARGVAATPASVQASVCWPLVRYALLQQALALEEQEEQGAEDAVREWAVRAITRLRQTRHERRPAATTATATQDEEEEGLLQWAYALEACVVGVRGNEHKRSALVSLPPHCIDWALRPRVGALRLSNGQLSIQWGEEAKGSREAWVLQEGAATTVVALGLDDEMWALGRAQQPSWTWVQRKEEGRRCRARWTQQQQAQGQHSMAYRAFAEAVRARLGAAEEGEAWGLKQWWDTITTPLAKLHMATAQEEHD